MLHAQPGLLKPTTRHAPQQLPSQPLRRWQAVGHQPHCAAPADAHRRERCSARGAPICAAKSSGSGFGKGVKQDPLELLAGRPCKCGSGKPYQVRGRDRDSTIITL